MKLIVKPNSVIKLKPSQARATAIIQNSDASFEQSFIVPDQNPKIIPDIQYQLGVNPVVTIPYTNKIIEIPSECQTLGELWEGSSQQDKKDLFDESSSADKNFIIPFFYNYPMPTGQLTLYSNYDDRWQEINIWSGLRSALPIWCRKPTLVNFYTLRENNIHGNTFRFTLENGNEPALATSGQVIQDHYLCVDFITGGSNSGTARDFTNTLSYINDLTFGGHSDWYWAGWKLLQEYFDENSIETLNKYESQAVLYSSSSMDTNGLRYRGIRCNQGSDAVNSVTYHRLKTSTNTQALIYRIR
jgi:hypothetical protein